MLRNSLIENLERLYLGSCIGSKAQKGAISPQSDDESAERTPQPGDDRYRGGNAGPFCLKVVGLEPDPCRWKRLPPVFLNIAATCIEINSLPIDFKLSFNPVVKAQHAMIGFHERSPGVPTHDPWGLPTHWPGSWINEFQCTIQAALPRINCQLDGVVHKLAFTDTDLEVLIGRPER